jgi:hypothetical protein
MSLTGASGNLHISGMALTFDATDKVEVRARKTLDVRLHLDGSGERLDVGPSSLDTARIDNEEHIQSRFARNSALWLGFVGAVWAVALGAGQILKWRGEGRGS